MKILILLILLGYSNINAQWYSATVQLTNEETIDCKTFILSEDQEKFKLKPQTDSINKVLIADSNFVKRITYHLALQDLVLEKLKIQKKMNGKTKNIWAEKLWEGDYFSIFAGNIPYFENNAVTGEIITVNYYLKIKDKDYAIPLGKLLVSSQKIKYFESKQLNSYVKDFTTDVKNQILSDFNFLNKIDLVERYNINKQNGQ